MSKNRFSGYTIDDIIGMSFDEFIRLNKSELRQAVSRLSSTANKRLSRLLKNDLISPAQLEAMESGGKFGTKGKDILALQVEFRRVSNFLTSRTSTVTGARALQEETRETLRDLYGINIDKDEYKKLLEGYSAIINESPDFQSRALRYKFLKDFKIDIADNSMTTTELSNTITTVLNRYYGAGGTQYEGTSNYFGFD